MIKVKTLKGHVFYVSEMNCQVEVIPEGKAETGRTIPEVTFFQFSQSRIRIEKFELGMTEIVQIEDLPMWIIEGHESEEVYLAKKEEEDKKNKEILDARRAAEKAELEKKLEKKAKKLANRAKQAKKK